MCLWFYSIFSVQVMFPFVLGHDKCMVWICASSWGPLCHISRILGNVHKSPPWMWSGGRVPSIVVRQLLQLLDMCHIGSALHLVLDLWFGTFLVGTALVSPGWFCGHLENHGQWYLSALVALPGKPTFCRAAPLLTTVLPPPGSRPRLCPYWCPFLRIGTSWALEGWLMCLEGMTGLDLCPFENIR